ncbi:MAG TPA: hypothetical protein VKY40_10220, partial [Halanaerobiales bacterium]|nr:hypothetical protein [Halanaerobiales bacterium]
LILVMAVVFTGLASEKPEPANNAQQNARIERGPGLYCGECEGEAVQLQRRMQEKRELSRGENGEKRQLQKRLQKQTCING